MGAQRLVTVHFTTAGAWIALPQLYLLKRTSKVTPTPMKVQRLMAIMRSIRLTLGERLGVFLELR
jgi:hypothetical protein